MTKRTNSQRKPTTKPATEQPEEKNEPGMQAPIPLPVPVEEKPLADKLNDWKGDIPNHEVTYEDVQDNPELKDQGVKAGDELDFDGPQIVPDLAENSLSEALSQFDQINSEFSKQNQQEADASENTESEGESQTPEQTLDLSFEEQMLNYFDSKGITHETPLEDKIQAIKDYRETPGLTEIQLSFLDSIIFLNSDENKENMKKNFINHEEETAEESPRVSKYSEYPQEDARQSNLEDMMERRRARAEERRNKQ